MPKNPLARDVYELILRHPSADLDLLSSLLRAEPSAILLSLQELESLRLISKDSKRGTYTGNSPNVALASVVAPLENQVEEIQSTISEVRSDIGALAKTFRDVRTASDSSLGYENISSPRQVQEILAESIKRVQHKVLICQPLTDFTDSASERSQRIDTELLRRGVARQTLVSTRTLEDKGTQRVVSALTPLGAEFRTVDYLPTLFMIFDDSLAVIQRNESPEDFGAILLTDPALVGIFSGFFGFLWERAADYLEPGESPIPLTPTQRSILSAMAVGISDEVIARRLAMSVRTCRRHIAKIMSDLGAESRFQAGVRAAQAGWLG